MDALWQKLMELPWAQLSLDWGGRIALALAVLFGGLWLSRLLVRVLSRVLDRAGTDPMLRDFLRQVTRGAMMVVVVIAALDQLGVPTTSLLAALGAAGLAVGLALRDSLSNLAAGVMLILLKPFRAGDVVRIGVETGKVESLRLMHTVLVTADNCELVLPNNRVANEAILNYTARGTRRLELLLGLAYGSDLAAAMSVIRTVLAGDARVLPEPAVEIAIVTLTDTRVEIAVRPWTRTTDYWPLRSDLLLQLKQQLMAAGFELPLRAREVLVRAERGGE